MTAEPEWRRPHPMTVVVLVLLFINSNALPIIVVLAFGGGGLGFDTVAAIGGAVGVGLGVLGWFMTGYAVTDDAVHYRSGILNRQARSIPLARIQQVAVLEPVVARVVGLAVVRVAEASADGEVEIRFLGKADAAALTLRLRALARPGAAVSDALTGSVVSSLAPPPAPPAAVLHTTSIGTLIRFLVASAVPALAVGGAAVATAAVVVAVGFGGVAAALTALIGAAVLVAFLGLATAVAVLTNGGFRLQRSPRSLTIEAGLLSRRQVEVRPDRIQTLTVSSGPVARRIDLHQIQFSAAVGKSSTQATPIAHLAPAARTDEVVRIVQGSTDVDPAFGVDLESVSAMTVRRQLVRSALVYVLLVVPASLALMWSAHPVAGVVPLLVWWPPAVWYARARYRRYGVAIDARRLVVRRGVFAHHLTQVPLSHVQSVSTRATYFQRRLGLCDLIVATAGIGPSNHVSVPDLPDERCRAFVHELAAAAAASRWELRL